jgi:hypothetical protein
MRVVRLLCPSAPLVPVLIVLSLVVSGCSGQRSAIPVTCQVKARDGKPAVGAILVFNALDGGEGLPSNKPTATVEDKESGICKPTTWKPEDGLPEGEYGVTILWLEEPAKASMIGGGEQKGLRKDRLGDRYNDAKNPKFKIRVEKGKDNTFTFDLE